MRARLCVRKASKSVRAFTCLNCIVDQGVDDSWDLHNLGVVGHVAAKLEACWGFRASFLATALAFPGEGARSMSFGFVAGALHIHQSS